MGAPRPPRPAFRCVPPGARAALCALALLGAPSAGCRAPGTTELAAEPGVALPDDVHARLARSLAHLVPAPAGQLRVLTAEAVDWPDASLGCPQPGIVYTQVVTPGWRLAVSDGTTVHDVHADAGAHRVLVCP